MRFVSTILSSAAVAVGLLAALPVLAAQPEIPKQEADPALNAMLPDAIKESGTIKLATDANYPPCQWYLEDGKTMVGYEVDIWDALAQKLGVTLEVSSIDFGGLLPGVIGGRYDVAMECITDRVEREEQVMFVNHSYDYGNAFFYLTSTEGIDASDVLSLCGLRTAGQTGTDFVDKLEAFGRYCVEHGKATVEVSQYPTGAAVLLALFAGRIDFALTEASRVEEVRANNPVDLGTIMNPLEKQSYLGIVIAKENQQLADALLAALVAIQDNGAYDQIMDKWNLGHAKLKPPGINLTTTRPIN
jgi:polar amino acid transport system substrate-binding protein